MLRCPVPAEQREAATVALSGQFLAVDRHARRCDDDLVLPFHHHVAVDFAGHLSEVLQNAVDDAVARAHPRDVRDDEVAVVDGVFDRDGVALFADLRESNLNARVAARGVEVVQIQFDVVLGAVGAATAEDLAHDAHGTYRNHRLNSSCVRRREVDGGFFIRHAPHSTVTYSICVREREAEGYRFGVAAAARVPAVGSVCPHVGDGGAVAVAGVADRNLGARCLAGLADGQRLDAVVGEATEDDAAARWQLHGVDAASSVAHTGDDCRSVAGHREGNGYTVAGTSMADDDVLGALEQGYTENERDAPLVHRLLTALAAGERAGGDGRDLPVGSAAVVVRTPGAGAEPLYHDLRVDASETPVADLRETYRGAKRGYEEAVERYSASRESG